MRFDIRPGVRRLFRLPLHSRADIHAELDDELEAFIESRVDALVANGMTAGDARRVALAHLGASLDDVRRQLHTSAEHREHEMRIRDWLHTLMQDLRYAARGLRASPGFTAGVIVTVALGIGANAAMFGIVDRMLFRPPPMLRYPATAHQVYEYTTYRGEETAENPAEYATFADLTRDTRSFDYTAGYARRDLAIGVGDAARERSVAAVSATFFRFFDAPPVLGRYFAADDDALPEGHAVTVISHAYWETAFGQRADAIGSKIQIGPEIYTVIGIAPDGFVGLWPARAPVAYVPLVHFGAVQANSASFLKRGTNWATTYSWGWMSMMVRRKPGVSVEQANADLTHAAQLSYLTELKEQTGNPPIALAKPHAIVGSILDERGPNASSVSKVAVWLGGVAIIVLLIACANVANLLLARAITRRREIAVRLALGATRTRLFAQLLAESLFLAMLGGLAGLGVAQWGGAALRRALLSKTASAPVLADPRTLLFAAVAALVVGILSGVTPMTQAARGGVTLVGDLKSGAREGTAQHHRVRAALLVVQAALSVILLVGAGLFVRSLENVRSQRLGYDVDPIAIIDLNMRGIKLDTTATDQLEARLLAAASAVPGVTHATLSSATPFYGMWSQGLYVQGIDTVRRLGRFQLNAVSPDFFATFGTRILRGRAFTAGDSRTAPLVLVVSEGMAQRLWPGRDAMGQCVRMGADTMPCRSVVGISEDIRERNIGGDSATYSYYVPATQLRGYPGLALRTTGPAAERAEEIRRALQRVMPPPAYVTVTPYRDIIGNQTRSWELGATMFLAFGLLALAIAALGLYSTIAYSVAQRTHEMGVRIALGAQVGDVVLLVVRDGVMVSATGLALGAAIAAAASRWIAPLLFKESAHDPVVFGAVTVALLLVAIAASWIPAMRAARVDPQTALRSD